jgi:hypothetical protein
MSPERTNPLHRIGPYKAEVFLLLLALLPALYITLGNPNTILDWYSSDDGFLYFQVARNLAAGHGFTFDGINPTNGFHPLWLFVITPIFVLAQIDLLLPLRALIILSALLSAGSAILLYRLLARFIPQGTAAFVAMLWIVLPRIHDLTLHAGVEAGINAFCLLLFWVLLISFPAKLARQEISRRLVMLSIAGTLAILARLDNVFLVGFGGLWLWLRLWKPPAKQKQNAWRWRLQSGLAFFGPIAFILLLYISWNYFSFGTFSPISGEVKLWWGTLKNTVYGFPVNSLGDYIGQFFTDDPELGPWSLFAAPLYAAAEWFLEIAGQAVTVAIRRVALLAVSGFLATLIGVLAWLQREFLSKAARNLGLLPFFLGCLAQLSYYKLAGSVAQQPWYWISEMIFLLLLLGLLVVTVLRVIADALPKFSPRFTNTLGVSTFTLATILYLFFIQTAVRSPGDESNHFYINRARWLEANTEAGERIAITGAGNLAYFVHDRTIINMDGLMNTYDYLLSLQSGSGAQYLANLNVDYIFGNEYILTETNPYAPMLEGHLDPYQVFIFADRELPLWRFIP